MNAPRRAVAAVFGLLTWAGAGATLLACPICFRIEEGPVSNGVVAAVATLMGVTVAVLAAFGLFIRRFVRAESRHPATAAPPQSPP
jgi:heme/copper-type cytochrome/quinol oxidase subunit 2